MNARTKITSDKFSVSIYQIANSYGFKTIGKFHKFLQQCQPSAKLYLGTDYMRVNIIRKEVESLLK